MNRTQPAQNAALYSLGEREVKIFSFGLTALLILTFGAGMLLGTFWTGPVVERARREAEEDMRLAAAGAARAEPAGSVSEQDFAPPPSVPASEPAFQEPPAIVTEPVTAADPEPLPSSDAPDAGSEPSSYAAPSYAAEPVRIEPLHARPRPSWRRPASPLDQPAEPEPAYPAAETAVPQGVYAIQLGIFSVESNASAMVSRLAARGYEPYQVEEHRQKAGRSRILYSVRVGGYPTYGEAQQQAAELKAREGLDVMIRRPEG